MAGARRLRRDGSLGAGARPAGGTEVGRARRDAVPDWRTAAAWWVRRELGTPPDRLIRILDLRRIGDREAWVSLDTGARHVVAGLRHEPVAGGAAGTYAVDDGWYRLLYLVVVEGDHEAAG